MIEFGFLYLGNEDLSAIAVYLDSLKPIINNLVSEKNEDSEMDDY